MKIGMKAAIAMLIGLILAGCVSIPAEDDDLMLYDSSLRGVRELDASDSDR